MLSSRKIIKKLGQKLLQPLVKKYLSGSRKFSWKNINIIVRPGVFHPGLFFSTKVLLSYLEENIPLQNKSFLELGAGSGLISIFAAKKGAFVTSTDVSIAAVRNIKENAQKNLVKIDIIQSDLFSNIDADAIFDIIVINPPFYPQNPKKESEFAWFCGENFDYFKNLFRQLPPHIGKETKILMILSEDCKINRIVKMANLFGLNLQEVHRKKTWWEWNYIFEIEIKK